jgi:hypothetical protein
MRGAELHAKPTVQNVRNHPVLLAALRLAVHKEMGQSYRASSG